VTSLNAALRYIARGWPVIPCHWGGERRKHPLTKHGLRDASRDPAIVREWWRRHPDALIGVPTGGAIGAVVLDVDIKDDHVNGFDTLDGLGFSILPETPMAHTASGGTHLYFALPDGADFRNTEGARGRGIGPGLDWRGEGGYVIAPSPGSGYEWDPHWNFDTVSLAPVPAVLLPRTLERVAAGRPTKPTTGLSPYAEAALDSACRRIIGAPPGEQESVLNAEPFAIGTLAGAGAIPADFALRVLKWAAHRIPDYDSRRPWRAAEIERKVERAFGEGLRRPRRGRDAA
jgi:hypothetical protein